MTDERDWPRHLGDAEHDAAEHDADEQGLPERDATEHDDTERDDADHDRDEAPARPAGPGEGPRFMTLDEVADVLRVERADVQRLVDSTELLAIRVGDDGPWRVEREQLEQFIDDRYEAQQRLARFNEAASVDLPELFGTPIPEDS